MTELTTVNVAFADAMRWAVSDSTGRWHRLSQNLEPTRKAGYVRSRCGVEFWPGEMAGALRIMPEYAICKRCRLLSS